MALPILFSSIVWKFAKDLTTYHNLQKPLCTKGLNDVRSDCQT